MDKKIYPDCNLSDDEIVGILERHRNEDVLIAIKAVACEAVRRQKKKDASLVESLTFDERTVYALKSVYSQFQNVRSLRQLVKVNFIIFFIGETP